MVKIASAAMHGTRNTEENLKIYQGFIEEAAAQGADLLVLPELSLQGFPASMLACDPGESYELTRTAERVPDGPSTRFMIEQAAKHRMYLVWGMYETAGEPGVIYNAAVLVGPEGFIGKHRKVHLPGVERLSSTPGGEFHTYDTKIGKIGLCVCYDKVFPESTRTLALQGAQIVCAPTAWPCVEPVPEDPQAYCLNIVDQARALENQFFLVASNHVGPYEGELCCGQSRIIDPNGIIVATTDMEHPGLAVWEGDVYETISAARCGATSLIDNLLRDRRPDTYFKEI